MTKFEAVFVVILGTAVLPPSVLCAPASPDTLHFKIYKEFPKEDAKVTVCSKIPEHAALKLGGFPLLCLTTAAGVVEAPAAVFLGALMLPSLAYVYLIPESHPLKQMDRAVRQQLLIVGAVLVATAVVKVRARFEALSQAESEGTADGEAAPLASPLVAWCSEYVVAEYVSNGCQDPKNVDPLGQRVPENFQGPPAQPMGTRVFVEAFQRTFISIVHSALLKIDNTYVELDCAGKQRLLRQLWTKRMGDYLSEKGLGDELCWHEIWPIEGFFRSLCSRGQFQMPSKMEMSPLSVDY